MARTKRDQDLSDVRGQDTLMPVSPKDKSDEEGLSRDGETADAEGRGTGMEQTIDEGSEQEDGR